MLTLRVGVATAATAAAAIVLVVFFVFAYARLFCTSWRAASGRFLVLPLPLLPCLDFVRQPNG